MKYSLFLLFIFTGYLYAQTITANKEIIDYLKVENGEGIGYKSDMEGLYTPGAPEIDDNGSIWFFPAFSKNIIFIEKNNFKKIILPSFLEMVKYSNTKPSINQQGFFGYSWHRVENENIITNKLKSNRYLERINYFGPKGIIIDFIENNVSHEFISIEYTPMIFSMQSKIERQYISRNLQETRTWLPSQPGGFSIGEDGRLYKNGMPWSVVQPDDGSPAGIYLGKVMSGHNLWADGPGSRMDSVRYFTISNPQGKAEIILEVPWGNKHMMDPVSSFRIYNYGIGPWGEIYCLIAPPWKAGADYYEPEPGVPAELVVIRNHLKYFGRLNDKDVRLRKEPSTNSTIIGTYPAKTGFRILETGKKQETLGGQKNVWYRVRLLDGTEGWFFGAFVHNLHDGPNGLPPPWPNVADW